jgi:hypothetical protein
VVSAASVVPAIALVVDVLSPVSTVSALELHAASTKDTNRQMLADNRMRVIISGLTELSRNAIVIAD